METEVTRGPIWKRKKGSRLNFGETESNLAWNLLFFALSRFNQAIIPVKHNTLQPSIDMSYLSISNADKLN